MEELRSLLETTTVGQLIEGSEKLVELQYTTTVGETLEIMHQHDISSVPVAVPATNHSHPAQNCRNKEQTEKLEAAPDKSFAGMVYSLDILVYIAESITKKGIDCVSQVFGMPVHSVLDLCDKGRRLPLMSLTTSLLEAMKLMVDGMQSALVPLASLPSLRQMEQDLEGKERSEARYRMITERDIIQFIHTRRAKFHPVIIQSVESFGICQKRVLGMLGSSTLVEIIRCMHQERLTVVPIVDGLEEIEHVNKGQLLDVKGKQIAGSFSASEIKGCPFDAWCNWLTLGALTFLKKVNLMRLLGITMDTIKAHDDVELEFDMLCETLQFTVVSCGAKSPLEEVIERALDTNLQQVWVLEREYIVVGVVQFVDIFQAVLTGIC